MRLGPRKVRARVLSPAVSTLGFLVLYACLGGPFGGGRDASELRGATRSTEKMGGTDVERMGAASTGSSLERNAQGTRGLRVTAQISSVEVLSRQRGVRRALPKTEAELLRVLRAERAVVFDPSEVEVVRTPVRNFTEQEGGRIVLRRATLLRRSAGRATEDDLPTDPGWLLRR